MKNNLQIVASLLQLQSSNCPDRSEHDLFEESQRRIRAMAFVYEKLFRSPGLVRICIGEYLQELATQVMRSYGVGAQDLTLSLTTEEVSVHADTLIPCGLIVTELLSNSIEHAFPSGGKGEILMSCHTNPEGQFVLTVRDNGIGFPEGLNFRDAESGGLELVNLLTAQLNGTLSLERGGGTAFTLTFSELPSKAGL